MPATVEQQQYTTPSGTRYVVALSFADGRRSTFTVTDESCGMELCRLKVAYRAKQVAWDWNAAVSGDHAVAVYGQRRADGSFAVDAYRVDR